MAEVYVGRGDDDGRRLRFTNGAIDDPAVAAVESPGHCQLLLASGFQHGSKFHDQYELAELFWRNNLELFCTDDWAYSSEFC